jgi:hypothetical protein
MKHWGWASTAFYKIRAGRATIHIQMPPGSTLKHITFHKCEDTGDIIVKGQLIANNNISPSYNDGPIRTETDGGPAGTGGTGGTGEHH